MSIRNVVLPPKQTARNNYEKANTPTYDYLN